MERISRSSRGEPGASCSLHSRAEGSIFEESREKHDPGEFVNGGGEVNLLVSALALTASAFFAGMALLGRRGMHAGDAFTGATINIGSAMVLFMLAAPFTLEWHFWTSPAVWIFAAIGVLRPSLSNMLGFEGSKRLGPTVSTTVESVAPLFAMLGGVVFLSEEVTPAILLGAVGVVVGVMMLTFQKGGQRDWPLWSLSIPLLAALIRAAAHVAARWGLEILPNVIFSGLVAYIVSFAVSLGVSQLRKGGLKARLNREVLLWFTLAGVCNTGAIFTLNTALKLGTVTQVSPLTSTYPLFALFFSALFYRREKITRRMVLGVLLVVPSVALITLGG